MALQSEEYDLRALEWDRGLKKLPLIAPYSQTELYRLP